MDFLLSAASPLAALLAFLVAVGNLTEAARLRRKVAAWRVEAGATPSSYDAEILWSLHRSGVARLVAIDALPPWKGFVAWVFLAAIGYGLFDLGLQIGRLPPSERNWQGAQDSGLDIMVFFTPIIVAMIVDYMLERSLMRREIEHAFLSRESVLMPPIVEERLTPARRRPLKTVSDWKRAVSATLMGLALTLLLWPIGFMQGWSSDIPPDWIAFLLVGGVLSLIASLPMGGFAALTDGRTRWEHHLTASRLL